MGLLCIGSLLAEDCLQQAFPPPAGAGDLPPVTPFPDPAVFIIIIRVVHSYGTLDLSGKAGDLPVVSFTVRRQFFQDTGFLKDSRHSGDAGVKPCHGIGGSMPDGGLPLQVQYHVVPPA